MIPQPAGAFLHEPFLERAADPTAEGNGDLSLGAFLTMRLIDQFRPGLMGSHPGALAYQAKATWDFLAGLSSAAPDLNYMREIVRVAESAIPTRNSRMIWGPMLAFAHWLEGELRLAESLDVLETAMRLAAGEAIEEQVAAGLQRARVLRLAGRFPESRDSYAGAGKLASFLGDTHSELLSRIGRAVVSQKVGNLPEAEQSLRRVLADAVRLKDKDAQARATHDLANTLDIMNRTGEAVPLAFNAYELYEHPLRRVRALSDLGLFLKRMGQYRAAHDSFKLVLSGEASREIRINAMLEQMEVAYLLHERILFERLRQELEMVRESMPVDALVDLDLKVGMGLDAFGNRRKAEQYIRSAIQRAETHHLNEYAHRCEEALKQLPKGRPERMAPEATPGWRESEAQIQHVAERLHTLCAV